jgi:hypothetical protein
MAGGGAHLSNPSDVLNESSNMLPTVAAVLPAEKLNETLVK